MAEYIDREAVNALIKAECSPKVAAYLIDAVATVPAADVVPVVRCGECKHRDPEDKKCDCGGLEHAHIFPVADDWFCADGERKDGDGDV